MHTYVVWASGESNYCLDLTQKGFPVSARKQAETVEPPKNHTDIEITTTITEDKTAYAMQFETPDVPKSLPEILITRQFNRMVRKVRWLKRRKIWDWNRP